jgi:SAM-dependent methyltransferase
MGRLMTKRPLQRCARLVAALAWAVAGSVLAADEVPFVTTPDAVTSAMLELAQVGPRDHVIDLGSGDGRIVITAARRFGASGLGVEIVPELVEKSRQLARAAGVHERVEFRTQDLFETDLRRATVVTMYLLPEVNLQLRPRLLALAPGTRVVSHDWDMGDWKPDRTIKVDAPDKSIGLEKSSQVHLWIVPAQVHGLWCAAGASLEISQRFQRFSATLNGSTGAAPELVFDGLIDGPTLRAEGTHPVTLRHDAQGLRMFDTRGIREVAGRLFRRSAGARCAAP